MGAASWYFSKIPALSRKSVETAERPIRSKFR
jgi:hypothetical protein